MKGATMTLKERWQSIPPSKRKWIKRGLGIGLGALGGYAYYALVGCATGACPITSNPWITTGWGALIGLTASA
jgi:hypothetical protein